MTPRHPSRIRPHAAALRDMIDTRDERSMRALELAIATTAILVALLLAVGRGVA